MVIDYQLGNTRSVLNLIERLYSKGDQVLLSKKPTDIDDASHVIFPGQGAALACKKSLENDGLVQPIIKALARKPFLGICIGLHMLLEYTEEDNGVKGLNYIDGHVSRFDSDQVRVPHIGWNCVDKTRSHALMDSIPQPHYFYFAHSYYPTIYSEQLIHGTTYYQTTFPSFISKDNVALTQFHPEKSGILGERFIANFLNWRP